MRKPRATLLALAVFGALLALPAAASALTLTVIPAGPVALPTTTVNYQSKSVEVQLTNPGPGAANVEGLGLAGPDAAEFTLSGSNCGTGILLMGEKCQLLLSFKPTSLGHKAAELSFGVNGEGPQTVALEADSVAPELAFEPASHDFGLLEVNRDQVRKDFVVKNVGAAATNLDGFELVGPGASNGSYTYNWNCPPNLEPGSTCQASVDFQPREAGTQEAELRVRSGNFTATAALTGVGGEAAVRPAEEPVQLGEATVGGAPVVRTITLTNKGNIAAGFFLSLLAGGDAGSFQLLSESCTFVEILPGDSCTATVRFAPLDAGVKNARMAFFGDGDGPGIIFLRGEGIAPPPAPPALKPHAAFTPATKSFDPVLRGKVGKPSLFRLRNDGAIPLSVERAAIVGANLDQFRVAGDECSGEVLAPGAECLLRVRFTPRSRGAKEAKLRVWGEGGPWTAALAGRGTAPKPKKQGTSPRRHRAR